MKCFYSRFLTSLIIVEAVRAHLVLREDVKRDLPPFWDPAALAEYVLSIVPSSGDGGAQRS